MFKRKKPIIHQEQSIKMGIEELPTKALEITYQAFMNDYEDEPRAEIQQKLLLISKILNDRANDKTYQEGNGKLKSKLRAKFPQITDEQFNKMSKEEKIQLEKSLAEYDKLEKLAQKITKQEPETIEFEMKVETPVTIKQDTSKNDTHISVEKPKSVQDSIQETLEKQVIKPKKKPIFAFLKKKKVVKQIKIPVTDELVQTIDKIKQEQPEIFEEKEDKEVTTEQKNRAKLMEVATVKKLLFKKDKHDSKPKLDFKKLDEVYCMACKHSIKQHQVGGISSGCKKCGCLTTIEDIAAQKGIKLYEPSVVLDKIEQENKNVEELIKQTGQKEDVVTAEEQKANEETEYIKKQSEKMAAMQLKKPEPKKEPTIEELNKAQQKANEIIVEENKRTKEPDSYDATKKYLEEQEEQEPKTSKELKEGLQCICDHKLEEHFNNVEFCTTVGCNCKEFKEYPPQ